MSAFMPITFLLFFLLFFAAMFFKSKESGDPRAMIGSAVLFVVMVAALICVIFVYPKN
jgi:FtsH-binding integral membrane protein